MSIELSLLTVAIVVGLFFLFRSVALWYWKINDLVARNDKQIELLTTIATQNRRIIEQQASLIDLKKGSMEQLRTIIKSLPPQP